MTNLKNMRCYLCGPIDNADDHGIGWRNYITPKLQELGVHVLNPCDKPIEFADENIEIHKYRQHLKNTDNYDKLSELMKQIRSVDLRMVDISDFIIVNFDISVTMCGTYEEIFWANRLKRPILLYLPYPCGKATCPDWLFGTIPHHYMFDNWKKLFSYLWHINTFGDDKDNRWMFFKYEK